MHSAAESTADVPLGPLASHATIGMKAYVATGSGKETASSLLRGDRVASRCGLGGGHHSNVTTQVKKKNASHQALRFLLEDRGLVIETTLRCS